MPKIKTLLLFTNNYPANYGDTSFIEPEAEALSKAYDLVYVVRFSNQANDSNITMPSNFHLIELGLTNRLNIVFKGLFNKTSIFQTYQLLWQERQYIKKISHLKNLFFATLLGRYFASKLNPLLQNNQMDFDAYLFWGMGSGYSLPWLKHKKLNKVWMRLHGGDLYLDRQNGYIPFRLNMLNNVDSIVPISLQGANYLQTTYPTYNFNQKIFVNYLGSLDYGIASTAPKQPHFVIVSCSSIIPLKRIELIYQSILLASKTIKIHWHHFGDGVGMSDLKKSINSQPNHENLTINLHGQTPHRQIIEFYQSGHVDLFINLSETEGIPVSIMEAISFNIPAIATDVGGVGEMIHHSFKTGILIPPYLTASDISAHIIQVLDNLLDFKPRQHWLSYFNKQNNMQKLTTHLNLNI